MSPTEAQEAYGWWAILYDFQTLAAALVALLGAGLTVWILHRQTKHSVGAAREAIDAQRDMESKRVAAAAAERAEERYALTNLLVLEALQTAIDMAKADDVAEATQDMSAFNPLNHDPPIHDVYQANAGRLTDVDPLLATTLARFHGRLRSLRAIAALIEAMRGGPRLRPNAVSSAIEDFREMWGLTVAAGALIAEFSERALRAPFTTEVFGQGEERLADALKREARKFHSD